ncbi:MAG: glycogen debranching enzyme N-terminal domain-containing protein [Bacteroidales bacterium]|nr:glycogen debranching enzyme N-terminal domain-containing protein [Bacteroidales bacterium]
MAFLKFNKNELVNLAYSLKREIISANKTGAYCNTSIVTCNTRRYHGLLAVTLDRFGGDRFLLLSALDESIIVNGKQFNLGIHCYGDIYEPRGHKYVVDFSADPVPQVTYQVGEVVLRKSLILSPDKDQILIRYDLLRTPAPVTLILKPFLAFRNIHALTSQNDAANTSYTEIPGGVSFRMYPNFPDLHLQLSDKDAEWKYMPCWNNRITYSDEFRRGFDCTEDLFTPGVFNARLGKGGSLVFSASLEQEEPAGLKRRFTSYERRTPEISGYRDQLVRCADSLITRHNGVEMINAGLSWMYTGLLRETLQALPGLTLHGLHSPAHFEEILDNLVAEEQERLLRRTTQVEAPLYLACTLQAYLDYGADPKKVWKKYGVIMKDVIDSYMPGCRKEVAMHPNGLLWAQVDGVALTWMNAYIGGRAVTERAGYQVETNAFWYNAICFALEMEGAYGPKGSAFVAKWSQLKDMIKDNFISTFWNEERGCLADYVDGFGQNLDVRPNQLYAVWVKNSPVDEEMVPSILRVIDGELVTSRGIRTLSPRDVKYKGVYEGSQLERDLAYHQGCTRPFLLEQYVDVSLRVKGPAFIKKAEWLVEGFWADLSKHGVGAFSELYDGDPPHEPHGAISSALSTAALLTVEYLLDKQKEV